MLRAARAGVAAGALAAALLACRHDEPAALTAPLPVRVLSVGSLADGKISLALRGSILPTVRREDPLRLVVDLAEQPDWAAISREIDRASPSRARREELFWKRLETPPAGRAAFLEWLAAQPGAGNVRAFRCINRVAFDGNENLVKALADRGDVAWIWGRLPDEVVTPPQAVREDVRGQGSTWSLETIGATKAWERGVRGEGVVVAVMDSGVTGAHPALAGRQAVPPRDALAGQPDPGGGHGSAVLAAAVGEGLGVAPGARWTAVNPLPQGHLDPEVLADSIDWLLETARPDVVVAPWDAQADGPADALAVPLGALRAAGMALVFPAGNFGPEMGLNHRPSNLTGLGPDGSPAFSVGGASESLEAYQFSCRGPSAEDGSLFPQVTAPAVKLTIADADTGGTRVGHGTSFAAGYAAGALALVLSTNPKMTGPEAEHILSTTARDLGAPGPDNTFGHGLIDIPAALAATDQLSRR